MFHIFNIYIKFLVPLFNLVPYLVPDNFFPINYKTKNYAIEKTTPITADAAISIIGCKSFVFLTLFVKIHITTAKIKSFQYPKQI